MRKDGLIFRAALRQALLSDKFRVTFRQRRSFLRLLDSNPEIVEVAMLMLDFEPETVPQADGVIIDAIMSAMTEWLKWILEHPEEIAKILEAITAMILAIIGAF